LFRVPVRGTDRPKQLPHAKGGILPTATSSDLSYRPRHLRFFRPIGSILGAIIVQSG
jgi:hypothetical protein